MTATISSPPRILGRYALYDPIASGGMATVHFGRLLGPVGFARTVAIKRLHPQFAQDPEFVSMFLDEARLAARIRHPNVVPTLDVVALDGELFLVMDYVQGEPLGALLRASRKMQRRVPVPYAVAIVSGVLRGLHAAHETKDERGNSLGIVHRDVSPQNILVGVDGVSRVLDFGVAKAAGRLQETRAGQIKGKIAYMPPEQIDGGTSDRRTDVYAAGAVLWETLTGVKLYQGDSDIAVFAKVMEGKVVPPGQVVSGIPAGLDAIVMCALSRSPDHRFPDAREMARALDSVVPLVAPAEIGEWVETTGADQLANRTLTVSRIEVDSNVSNPRAEGFPQWLAAGSPASSSAPRVSAVQAAPAAPVAASSRSPAHEAPPAPQVGENADISVVESAVFVGPRGQQAAEPAIGASDEPAPLDRRWIALGGAGAGLLLFAIVMAVVHVVSSESAGVRTEPSSEVSVAATPSPAPPPPTATAIVSAAKASLPPPPSATAPVQPSVQAPSTRAAEQPPPVHASPKSPPTPAVTPKPHPAGPPLGGVLDSRK